MNEKIKSYMGQIIPAGLFLLVLYLIGVPLVIPLIAIGVIFAYSKGYRVHITIIRKVQ